jgi:hypothetical protein
MQYRKVTRWQFLLRGPFLLLPSHSYPILTNIISGWYSTRFYSSRAIKTCKVYGNNSCKYALITTQIRKHGLWYCRFSMYVGYSVILRRVRESLLPRKINKYYIFVYVCACVRVPGCVNVCLRVRACSLAYSACNSYAPCCDVISDSPPPRSPRYFSTLSHKRRDFRKKSLNIKCVFWFSLQLLFKTFFILRRI